MMAVVCFDLIPEALKIGTIYNTIIGIILGIITMIYCDIMVERKFNSKSYNSS